MNRNPISFILPSPPRAQPVGESFASNWPSLQSPSPVERIVTMFAQISPLDKLYKKVFRLPENQWVLDTPCALRCIQILFESLPRPSLKYLSSLDLFLIRSDGILASTVAPRKKSHLIIVYPALYKMMASAAPLCATAILAHELGHIVLKHSQRNITPAAAQLEADRFAAEMGFARELLQVLADHKGTPDYPERAQALTAFLNKPSPLLNLR